MENRITFYEKFEQGSVEWDIIRRCKFTASEIHKLCKPKGLGQGGETYIESKVAEIMTGGTHEIPNMYAMEWGKYHEPIARQFYTEATDTKIEEYAFIENSDFKNCGASPDGVSLETKTGFEIKCPENQANHVKHLKIKDWEQLKKVKPEYYWQCVFSMLISDFNEWVFISFHPDFTQKKDFRMWVLKIPFVQEEIDFLANRINQANIILEKTLSDFNIKY